MRNSPTFFNAEIIEGNINSVPIHYAIGISDKYIYMLVLKLTRGPVFILQKNTLHNLVSARIGSAIII
jgi:hypothetical protein